MYVQGRLLDKLNTLANIPAVPLDTSSKSRKRGRRSNNHSPPAVKLLVSAPSVVKNVIPEKRESRAKRSSLEIASATAAASENVNPATAAPTTTTTEEKQLLDPNNRRGRKRKHNKSPSESSDSRDYDNNNSSSCVWAKAAEIVRQEREAAEQLLRAAVDEVAEVLPEEELYEFDPLITLGMGETSTSQVQRTSIELQEFQEKIGSYYRNESRAAANNNSPGENLQETKTENPGQVLRPDDPFQPKITGAPKRKAYFGRLRCLDLATSKPFHKYELYNLCATRRDASGQDSHLLQWFAPDPDRMDVD